MRLVRSGRWNPPVGTHGRGAQPHTEDTEEVEDPLTDILSKSTVDPGSDPGGGVAKDQVLPLLPTPELWLVQQGSLQVGQLV